MKKRRQKEQDAERREAKEGLRKITHLLMKSSLPLGKTALALGSMVEQHSKVARCLMGRTCELMLK